MSENKFYDWPACTNCESILPRAVLIQRICNLAYINLDVIEMTLPAAGPEFNRLLINRMQALPYLEMDGQKFKTSREIWYHLVTSATDKDIRSRLQKADSIYSFMTLQWANECFINSLVYARWKREENYGRFISNVDFGKRGTPESIQALRAFTLRYLSRTVIGEVSEADFRTLLMRQLAPIAKLADDNQFLEAYAKHPTLTDLHVFMVVQGLLSPDLEESQVIRDSFPSIVRWYNDVNTLTQKDRLTGFHKI